ncbi:insulinase family protein [Archangium violaceum]|uniref:M16 family metallopeptidase n=1 Tax=Archangium violaceum TaxID=83451 RepID=UPI00193C71AA|nr:pitrilysin family protein [Archangium violaceum]QRK11350.1 insulinase family protein [Archangium violaceum]
MKVRPSPRSRTAARLVWMMLTAVLLLLVPSGCATSSSSRSEPPLEPPAVRGAFVTYPSGMRLLVNEVPGAAEVSMTVSYRVGATDDPAGKEGLAHLSAFLTLTRHQKHPSLPLQPQLEFEGARIHPSFTHDTTDFILTIPPEKLSRVLSVEAQRMKDPLGQLTEAEFLHQRSLLAERLRQQDLPGGIMTWWLYERLLPGHPYGRVPMGTPESVERLTLEDVRAFVKQHYTPAHAVVVVAGPLSATDAKFEVAQAFVGLTGTDASTPVPPVRRIAPPIPQEPPPGTPMVQLEGPVQSPRLYMAWTMPGVFSGKVFHFQFTRALFEEVLRRELEASPRVLHFEVKDHMTDGMMLLAAQVDVRDTDEAQALVRRVQERLARVLSPDSIDHARRALAAYGNQLLQELAKKIPTDHMAMTLRATGRPDHINIQRQQIQTLITSETELADYLRTYLRPERVRLMLVRPQPAGWHEALARAKKHSNRGDTLRGPHPQELGTAGLERAVAAYRSALSEMPRQHAPLLWAETQTHLGDTLLVLGMRQPGTRLLEEAKAAYQAALEERTRERVPWHWALTQYALGNTLLALESRSPNRAQLQQAVEALRASLEVELPELTPQEWASRQGNLGAALLMLGQHTRNAALLCESRSRYALALSRARGEDPARDTRLEQGLEAGTKLLRHQFGERALRDCMKKTASSP